MTPRAVTIVRQDGLATVIEWREENGPRRAVVPSSSVRLDGNQAVTDEPELGAPYGEPWAMMFKSTVTPEAVERAFHEYGIWTAADVERNHVQAMAALASLFAADLGSLVRSARNHSREPLGGKPDEH